MLFQPFENIFFKDVANRELNPKKKEKPNFLISTIESPKWDLHLYCGGVNMSDKCIDPRELKNRRKALWKVGRLQSGDGMRNNWREEGSL